MIYIFAKHIKASVRPISRLYIVVQGVSNWLFFMDISVTIPNSSILIKQSRLFFEKIIIVKTDHGYPDLLRRYRAIF